MDGRVEIAGGGLAGMAMAAALAQEGGHVRVHERRPELREEGGGIGLSEYAFLALDEIGASEEVVANAARLTRADLRDHQGRLHMAPRFYAQAGRHYSVSRFDLHRAIMNAAVRAGVEIVTSSSAIRASPSGTLEVEGGDEFSSDLIVGADGVGSVIRENSAIRHRVRDLNHLGLRIALDYDLPEVDFGCLYERWNGERRIGYVQMGPRRLAVYMSCPPRDVHVDRRHFDVDPWVAAFPEQADIIKGVGEAEGVWAPLSEVVCEQWSIGRLVLIGDAAHAMPPHRGQGGALAIQDAVVLATRLGRLTNLKDLAEVRAVVERWEADIRSAVRLMQRSSVLFCLAQSKWPRPLLGSRPLFLRAVIRWMTPDIRALAGQANG